VTVLFADLVGFTSLSESRRTSATCCPRYFETCRTLISRYGGVVEKFIGDAAIAIWGTPTTREDDAERAVRGAIGRLAAAEPRWALVGEATKRATEAAISYRDGFRMALECAFELGDHAKVRALIDILEGEPPGKRLQSMDALALRFRGRLAALEGDTGSAGRSFKAAAGLYRELEVLFPLAVTLLEHAEWLVGEGTPEEAHPLLSEAREIFERLKAIPWLERLEEVEAGARV
jgi:hypothetical protein